MIEHARRLQKLAGGPIPPANEVEESLIKRLPKKDQDRIAEIKKMVLGE